MELGLTPEDVEGRTFMYGRGCDYCNNTGYKGRMGVFEIMPITDPMRELIMQRASSAVLREAARKTGMRSLRENGLMAIFEGQTTLEEVVRETIIEE